MKEKEKIDFGNDLLFHSTDDIEVLKSVIKNGFYPSYSKETFAGRDQKILMVSFSYEPIKDAIKTETYGKYKIGVTADWAKKNNLHPVHYTFEESYFEQAVVDLIEIATAGQCLTAMVELKKAKCVIETKGLFLDKMKAIAETGINEEQAKSIDGINQYITNAAFSIHFFAKNYQVKLKEGTIHTAFFDREWRYIPKQGINGHGLLLFKEAFGKESEDYKYWEKQDKPHGKNIPLVIDIADIKFLMVAEDNEIALLLAYLEEQYGREKISKLIESGSLELVSQTKSKEDV